MYAGFPPVVVPAEARLEYIHELWSYQRAVGVASVAETCLLPEPERLGSLKRMLVEWWRATLELVAEAKSR